MKAVTKRKIKRKCLVCGKEINVILHGKKYTSSYYFGKFRIPVGPGEYKKMGNTTSGRIKADIVKWSGKEKDIEYWECNKCCKL